MVVIIVPLEGNVLLATVKPDASTVKHVAIVAMTINIIAILLFLVMEFLSPNKDSENLIDKFHCVFDEHKNRIILASCWRMWLRSELRALVQYG